MRANTRMKGILTECGSNRALLASDLRALLSEGLENSGGCLLLRSQLKLTQANVRQQFQDDTGYECFVNHLHLEDILASTDTCFLIGQALAFADELLVKTSSIGVSEPLEYIIGSDDDGVNIRFHLLRPGQHWLVDDLEKYGEGVAAVRLADRQRST